ncbi:MAG: lipid-A-disaccharide synthase [Rhizobiales bacterium]|nr:lipid-A-disaccharide synthase [Hyphomicrobiales bacterium]
MRVFIVAGEASGDQLGASLIRALHTLDPTVEIACVGGAQMEAAGTKSLFPLSDIAVMGLGPVIRRLPTIIRRINQSVAAVLDFRPDVLVTIDSPDFSKRVAKRVHKRNPGIGTVHWVCPSVWAWRPGRAPAMRRYIDHVLCLLPFEPAALERLNGPPGTYIGHPAIERLAEFRPGNTEERARRDDVARPPVLLLPGSRLSEIRRMLPEFLASLDLVSVPGCDPDWLIPTLPHLEAEVRAIVGASGRNVQVAVGEASKLAAFRSARAALAASGTVTLELALAGIPTIAAYRVANWEAAIARRLITAPSAILPNLVLGENVVPEFIQEAMTREKLATHLAGILVDGPARQAQIDAFARLEALMRPMGAKTPSQQAAEIVMALALQKAKH